MKTLSILFISLFTLSACQTITALRDDLSSGNLQTARIVNGQSEILLASPCPQVEIVDDLSSLSDFLDPKKTIKSQLISRVNLGRAESSCKLASKSAIIDLKLIFKGAVGKKGRKKASDKPFFSYPFFIAVTSPNGKIMAKEIFAASMTYGSKEGTHTYFEKLRQIIPIKSKQMARHYKILIGFQLTPDQLAYNRAHMVPVIKQKLNNTKTASTLKANKTNKKPKSKETSATPKPKQKPKK